MDRITVADIFEFGIHSTNQSINHSVKQSVPSWCCVVLKGVYPPSLTFYYCLQDGHGALVGSLWTPCDGYSLLYWYQEYVEISSKLLHSSNTLIFMPCNTWISQFVNAGPWVGYKHMLLLFLFCFFCHCKYINDDIHIFVISSHVIIHFYRDLSLQIYSIFDMGTVYITAITTCYSWQITVTVHLAYNLFVKHPALQVNFVREYFMNFLKDYMILWSFSWEDVFL